MNSNVNYCMNDIINFADKNKNIIIMIVLLIIVIMYYNSTVNDEIKCDESNYDEQENYEERESYINPDNYEEYQDNIEHYDNIEHNDNIEHMSNIDNRSTPNVIHVNNIPISEEILTPRTKEIVLSCILKTNNQLDILNNEPQEITKVNINDSTPEYIGVHTNELVINYLNHKNNLTQFTPKRQIMLNIYCRIKLIK